MTLKTFLYIFLLNFLMMNLYAQDILRIVGKQVVLRTTIYDLEMGEKYYLLIKGKTPGKKKIYKKKILVKVIKTLNDKALVKVLKGRPFLGASIFKVKPLIRKRRKSKNITKNKSNDYDFSFLGGLVLVKAGPFVEEAEDVGYAISLLKGVDFGLRYNINTQIKIRSQLLFSKGSAEYSSSTAETSMLYSYFSIGGSYRFYDLFYGFLDLGKATWSLSTDILIDGETTSSKTILSGSGYRIGLGYEYILDSNLSVVAELGLGTIKLGSRESDVEVESNSSESSNTIDYAQSIMHSSVHLAYSW